MARSSGTTAEASATPAPAIGIAWPRALLERVCARIPGRVRRLGEKLAEWDRATDEGRDDASAWARRLRYGLPFAIVAVSIGAAAMGWQASVAEERATHHDVVARQDLVRLSQIKLQKLQTVGADLRAYGDLERSTLIAQEQFRDARTGPKATRRRLDADGSVNAAVAVSLAEEHHWLAGGAPGSREPYDVRAALTQAETGDADLSSVEPNLLRAEARDQRDRSLRLTGLAVLYVAGLVFFTLAAVTGGRRAFAFAALGVVAALAAAAAFPIVRWS